MLTYILTQRLAFANRCVKMRKMREGTAMKLQREYFSVEKDGFFGAYFPNPKQTDRCMIALLGDDIDD